MSEFVKRQDVIDIITKHYDCESDRLTAIQNLPVLKQEYYGWIFIQEALPPQGESVLTRMMTMMSNILYQNMMKQHLVVPFPSV